MKADLGRILNKENIGKEIRQLWQLKTPHILAALKKMNCHAVNNIFKLDDCEVTCERDFTATRVRKKQLFSIRTRTFILWAWIKRLT
jgi:hypothetical protein